MLTVLTVGCPFWVSSYNVFWRSFRRPKFKGIFRNADKSYLRVLPVDPITQKQEWGVVRNKDHQVIGVHSVSNDAPTLFAKLFVLSRWREVFRLGIFSRVMQAIRVTLS